MHSLTEALPLWTSKKECRYLLEVRSPFGDHSCVFRKATAHRCLMYSVYILQQLQQGRSGEGLRAIGGGFEDKVLIR
jgi:hypothetical protein